MYWVFQLGNDFLQTVRGPCCARARELLPLYAWNYRYSKISPTICLYLFPNLPVQPTSLDVPIGYKKRFA